MIERDHTYIYRLGAVDSGQIFGQLDQPTDTDAPFVLRAIGGYYIVAGGTADETVTNLPNLLLFRYADADNHWLQTARTPGMLAQTVGTDYLPLRKHVTYPPQAVIRFGLSNQSGGALAGVVLVFRGVKLYPGGFGEYTPVYSPTYPPCYATESYQYVFNYSLAAAAVQLNQPVNINDDADFAIRGGLMDVDVSVATHSNEGLEVRLRDVYGQAYSSEGTGGGLGAWIRANRIFSGVSSAPGLWYPELYVEKGRQFQLDLRNQGVGIVAAGQFAFDGAKVFRR